MKLIRFGNSGEEKPGLLLADGRRIDASAFGSDYDERFFGGDGLERLAAWADANADTAPVVDPSVRLGPCIARPSKIVCVGLNYSDHAKESGMPIPAEPILFFKSTSSSAARTTPSLFPVFPRKPTGKSSSPSSSARRLPMYPRKTP